MDIIFVGGCITDFISYASRLPIPGESLPGDKFAIGFGGKGANPCICAARMGARVGMIGMVGKDRFGDDTIENFKTNGVSVDHVSQTSESHTGTATIWVDSKGQNSIIVVCGANMYLSESDIESARKSIQTAKVLAAGLEVSLACCLAALRTAKENGVLTILNAAPAVANLDKEFYTVSDIFCVNETEAEILTGVTVSTPKDAALAIEWFLEKGCHVVIVTLGEYGSVFASQKDRKAVHVKADKVTCKDSTGAGDAFVAGLAFYKAYYPQLTLHDVVQRAGKIATLSVQKPGTQTSYSWKKDLPSELFQKPGTQTSYSWKEDLQSELFENT